MKYYFKRCFQLLLLTASFINSNSQDFQATQNWLTGVSTQTCLQRSREILVTYGYNTEVQSNGTGIWGTKPNGNAWLTCQACGDKTITTIILGNLPSTNMVELRGIMLDYISTGSTGTTTGTGNLYTIKNVFGANEKITVEFRNLPGNPTDWINIVPKGSADGSAGNWQYINGQKSGTLIFNALPPGEYETRAFYNNSYKVEYRYVFRVGTGGNTGGDNLPVSSRLLKLEKSRFAANEKIEVQFFELPGSSSDWINIVPKGSTESTPGNWQYTGGQKSGRLTFNALTPGEYEVRVYFNNSYKLEDRLGFKIVNN